MTVDGRESTDRSLDSKRPCVVEQSSSSHATGDRFLMSDSDSPTDGATLQAPASERAELDPEREDRRHRALSVVRSYGDPVLRAKALPVTKFDERLASEVAQMSQLMQDALGIGLAATQLGVMQRLLVYRTSIDGPLIAVVNPELEWVSDQLETAEEGCLSLPGVAVDVERALHLRVTAQDPAGEEILIEASGIEARVLQHEIDHLDGILIIDRSSREQRREALRILREGPGEAERALEVVPA
jgi:peptide deformylase